MSQAPDFDVAPRAGTPPVEHGSPEEAALVEHIKAQLAGAQQWLDLLDGHTGAAWSLIEQALGTAASWYDADHPAHTASTGEVVVVCVRDPDDANAYTVFPEGAVRIIDIDLGYSDLTQRDEFLGWAGAQLGRHDDLPEGHPARDLIVRYVDIYRSRWHTEFSGIEDVRAAAADNV